MGRLSTKLDIKLQTVGSNTEAQCQDIKADMQKSIKQPI